MIKTCFLNKMCIRNISECIQSHNKRLSSINKATEITFSKVVVNSFRKAN